MATCTNLLRLVQLKLCVTHKNLLLSPKFLLSVPQSFSKPSLFLIPTSEGPLESMKFPQLAALLPAFFLLAAIPISTLISGCSSDGGAYRSSHVRRYAVPPMADPGPPKPPKQSSASKRALAKQDADSEAFVVSDAPSGSRGTQPSPVQQPPSQAAAPSRLFTEPEKQANQATLREPVKNTTTSKSQPVAPAATATATVIAASASKTPQPYTARLGLISLVNNSSDFVLINIGTAPAPPPGSRLQSYSPRAGSTAAELSVSNYQRRPFLIADIISGDPKVGDSVVQVSRSGGIVSPGASQRATTSAPLVSPEPRSRSKTETKDNRLWSNSDTNSPSPTIFFDPDQRTPNGGSEAIIPGLPMRRGN